MFFSYIPKPLKNEEGKSERQEQNKGMWETLRIDRKKKKKLQYAPLRVHTLVDRHKR